MPQIDQDQMKAGFTRWAEGAGCRLLVHFGSSATADRSKPGDIDLAVDFRDLPGPERRLAVIGELQDLCGPRAVDVVFLHRDTNPVLRFEIFRTGTPLYEERPGLFIDETVKALSLYEDTAPFRKLLRQSFTRGKVRR